MPRLEVTVDQIVQLIGELSFDEKKALIAKLNDKLTDAQAELDPETQIWLEEELIEELPAYEWGDSGIPTGKPIRYVPGSGFVIEGGR